MIHYPYDHQRWGKQHWWSLIHPIHMCILTLLLVQGCLSSFLHQMSSDLEKKPAVMSVWILFPDGSIICSAIINVSGAPSPSDNTVSSHGTCHGCTAFSGCLSHTICPFSEPNRNKQLTMNALESQHWYQIVHCPIWLKGRRDMCQLETWGVA